MAFALSVTMSGAIAVLMLTQSAVAFNIAKHRTAQLSSCSCDCCEVGRRREEEQAEQAAKKRGIDNDHFECAYLPTPGYNTNAPRCENLCIRDAGDSLLTASEDSEMDTQRYCFFECEPAPPMHQMPTPGGTCRPLSKTEKTEVRDGSGNAKDPMETGATMHFLASNSQPKQPELSAVATSTGIVDGAVDLADAVVPAPGAAPSPGPADALAAAPAPEAGFVSAPSSGPAVSAGPAPTQLAAPTPASASAPSVPVPPPALVPLQSTALASPPVFTIASPVLAAPAPAAVPLLAPAAVSPLVAAAAAAGAAGPSSGPAPGPAPGPALLDGSYFNELGRPKPWASVSEPMAEQAAKVVEWSERAQTSAEAAGAEAKQLEEIGKTAAGVIGQVLAREGQVKLAMEQTLSMEHRIRAIRDDFWLRAKKAAGQEVTKMLKELGAAADKKAKLDAEKKAMLFEKAMKDKARTEGAKAAKVYTDFLDGTGKSAAEYTRNGDTLLRQSASMQQNAGMAQGNAGVYIRSGYMHEAQKLMQQSRFDMNAALSLNGQATKDYDTAWKITKNYGAYADEAAMAAFHAQSMYDPDAQPPPPRLVLAQQAHRSRLNRALRGKTGKAVAVKEAAAKEVVFHFKHK